MPRFVFGQDAECRHCHGAGERVVAATPEQKRAHAAQKRRDKDTPRIPLVKSCPDCDGLGYVPIAVADRA